MAMLRVPITQSYQMYYALKDNNVPVKFIAFPVSGLAGRPDPPDRDRAAVRELVRAVLEVGTNRWGPAASPAVTGNAAEAGGAPHTGSAV
ncbi:MAG: hypothetical protein M3P29_11200 [Acidobacteriota bacterium]|nr:hypothetical protein [Acidobacteriota bacterium]